MNYYLNFLEFKDTIMGCLCSKGTDVNDHVAEYEAGKENERSKSSAQLNPPEEVTVKGNDASRRSRLSLKPSSSSLRTDENNPKDKIIDRPKNGHRRHLTLDSMRERAKQEHVSGIVGLPDGAKGEQAAAGWPPWLTSAAGEAVKGWVPRSADSYEKLKKVELLVSRLSFPLFRSVASLTRLCFRLCRSGRGLIVVSTRLVI